MIPLWFYVSMAQNGYLLSRDGVLAYDKHDGVYDGEWILRRKFSMRKF